MRNYSVKRRARRKALSTLPWSHEEGPKIKHEVVSVFLTESKSTKRTNNKKLEEMGEKWWRLLMLSTHYSTTHHFIRNAIINGIKCRCTRKMKRQDFVKKKTLAAQSRDSFCKTLNLEKVTSIKKPIMWRACNMKKTENFGKSVQVLQLWKTFTNKTKIAYHKHTDTNRHTKP